MLRMKVDELTSDEEWNLSDRLGSFISDEEFSRYLDQLVTAGIIRLSSDPSRPVLSVAPERLRAYLEGSPAAIVSAV